MGSVRKSGHENESDGPFRSMPSSSVAGHQVRPNAPPVVALGPVKFEAVAGGDGHGGAGGGGASAADLDEFDDLTLEELKSLLENFKNLSKSEQMDLIQYMKKLEKTDPDKVRMLKEATTTTTSSTGGGGGPTSSNGGSVASSSGPPSSSVVTKPQNVEPPSSTTGHGYFRYNRIIIAVLSEVCFQQSIRCLF